MIAASWPLAGIAKLSRAGGVDLDALERLEAPDDIRAFYDNAIQWTGRRCNDDRFTYVPRRLPGEFPNARHLQFETDIPDLLRTGKVISVSPDELHTSHHAAANVFTVPQAAKKNRRLIQHALDLNDTFGADTLQRMQFETAEQRHGAVHAGNHALTFDFAAWYDQIPITDKVSRLLTFQARMKLYRLLVTAMGERHSVEVGEGCTRVIAAVPFRGNKSTYIDNLRLVGTIEELVTAGTLFVRRCCAVNARLNEIDIDWARSVDDDQLRAKIRSMVHSEGDWLGERVNYERKTVAVADKTLAKIAATWERRATWTWRQYAGFMALLFYAHSTLRFRLAGFFDALRWYARAMRVLALQPARWDSKADAMPRVVMTQLEQWRQLVTTNEPRVVSSATRDKPDYVIITDASQWGWGAIVMSPDGQLRTYAGAWETSFTDRHSTLAEPEAIYRALRECIPLDRAVTIRVHSDSSTAVYALLRTSSRSYRVNRILERIYFDFPLVTLFVEHIAGDRNPSDGISRNLPVSALDLQMAAEVAAGDRTKLVPRRSDLSSTGCTPDHRMNRR